MNPDQPDELKHVTVDVTFTVITCADCAGRERIDRMPSLNSTEACTCGCDGFLMLCQLCGKRIGWGSGPGVIDLDDF